MVNEISEHLETNGYDATVLDRLAAKSCRDMIDIFLKDCTKSDPDLESLSLQLAKISEGFARLDMQTELGICSVCMDALNQMHRNTLLDNN